MLAPASSPRAHADAFVELQKVTHTYGRGDKEVRALESTDLRIEKGDFIALVGPSGCGKSTILKLVTGLINASSGVVFVAGREVTAEPVRVGMAFQNPTLPPSSATASMPCSRRWDLPASRTNIPGSFRAG